MPNADTAQDRRDRLTAPLRAGLVASLALFLLPVPVLAADPGADPSGDPPAVEVSAEPSAEPTTDPTAEPTADPTAEPTPDPTADPTAEPTAEPTPDPTAGPTVEPSPGPLPTAFAARVPYRSAAIIRQYTNYWCVPAATMTMVNLIKGTSKRSYARQHSLYHQIRKHNRYRYRTSGNDVQGWAWALRKYTGFPYRARSYDNKTTALRAIASAIDRTGRPVGIAVHHGSHAWIVLGYKALPSATTPGARKILGYYVSGPLGPRSRDPWRVRYYSMASFRKVYSRYHESTRRVIWERRYVVVSE